MKDKKYAKGYLHNVLVFKNRLGESRKVLLTQDSRKRVKVDEEDMRFAGNLGKYNFNEVRKTEVLVASCSLRVCSHGSDGEIG